MARRKFEDLNVSSVAGDLVEKDGTLADIIKQLICTPLMDSTLDDLRLCLDSAMDTLEAAIEEYGEEAGLSDDQDRARLTNENNAVHLLSQRTENTNHGK